MANDPIDQLIRAAVGIAGVALLIYLNRSGLGDGFADWLRAHGI